MENKTLGLSMIVKNESHVILRLLNSVAPIIDYWVVADTGSTDGTQEIITKFFEEKGIPGQLLQIDWIDDFSYARNKSLEEVEKHVDYGFWIDADEELLINQNFNKQELLGQNFHSISVSTIYGRIDYTRKNIWKTGMNFKWDGPIHELLSSREETEGGLATGISVLVKPEGSSWGNIREKYLGHAKILQKHAEETNDPRWVFYTAQSYRDAQEYETSIEWYAKRAQMTEGFVEEVFISKFMMAKLSEVSGKTKSECANLYQDAHAADHARGESIKGIVQMYQRFNDWENAYVFSLYGLRYNRANPYPQRVLFLDKSLYDYEMLELHSLSCFYTNRIEEGSRCYWMMRDQLHNLGEGYLPEEAAKRVIENAQYFPISNIMKTAALQPRKPVFPPHGGSKKNRKKKSK